MAQALSRIALPMRYLGITIVMLFALGIGDAWASHNQHTATLNVAKGTGSGTVYASTSGSATSGSASASFNCGESSDGQHTGTLYAYATPASGYTFLGWTTSASSSAGADNSNPKGVAFDVNNASSKQTLYAHFVEKAKVNITFVAPSNGTYTIKVNGGSAETVSSADVVKNNVEGVVLTATPASGYAFAGWYKLNSAGEFVEDLSITSPYDASFTVSETIKMGARFVPTTLGKFILKGSSTEYYGLKAATIAAGGSGIIVPVAEETLVDGSDLMPFDNGTYTIKAGATLLVPHSSANEVQIKPEVVKSAATLSAFRTLVLKDGVNIVCNGSICVGGKIMSASGGSKSAYVTGPCGVINMANGGHIELNNGAKLYCWGF
ncbi:MAG: InlB B-repeat-containing protein, partial [Paludibacteraceae bacterium]|nr:InlB B-repeat-containing protein [Paludibacteraceae bacterium]